MPAAHASLELRRRGIAAVHRAGAERRRGRIARLGGPAAKMMSHSSLSWKRRATRQRGQGPRSANYLDGRTGCFVVGDARRHAYCSGPSASAASWTCCSQASPLCRGTRSSPVLRAGHLDRQRHLRVIDPVACPGAAAGAGVRRFRPDLAADAPVQLLIGGVLADRLGIRAVYYLGGLLLIAAALVGLTASTKPSPNRRSGLRRGGALRRSETP